MIKRQDFTVYTLEDGNCFVCNAECIGDGFIWERTKKGVEYRRLLCADCFADAFVGMIIDIYGTLKWVDKWLDVI